MSSKRVLRFSAPRGKHNYWDSLECPSRDVLDASAKRVVAVIIERTIKYETAVDEQGGVLVGPHHVLTAGHGIASAKNGKYWVKVDTATYLVERDSTRLFPNRDLAILTLRDTLKDFVYIKLAKFVGPQPVFWHRYIPIIGFREPATVLITCWGRITGKQCRVVYERKFLREKKGPPEADIEAEQDLIITPGISGTPLFNWEGELVGIMIGYGYSGRKGVAVLVTRFEDILSEINNNVRHH